ncbi:MAG: hypothetical protein NTX48_21520 [Planctomycetales bacterium]|nr:hypothetical protein [Planctomycetales bacterium]
MSLNVLFCIGGRVLLRRLLLRAHSYFAHDPTEKLGNLFGHLGGASPNP